MLIVGSNKGRVLYNKTWLDSLIARRKTASSLNITTLVINCVTWVSISLLPADLCMRQVAGSYSVSARPVRCWHRGCPSLCHFLDGYCTAVDMGWWQIKCYQSTAAISGRLHLLCCSWGTWIILRTADTCRCKLLTRRSSRVEKYYALSMPMNRQGWLWTAAPIN